MNMCTSAIEKIRISRFGPFDGSYDLSFVPGINVIVGDNGTGKSQLLKLLYSCTQVLQDESFEHTKTAIQRRIAEKCWRQWHWQIAAVETPLQLHAGVARREL